MMRFGTSGELLFELEPLTEVNQRELSRPKLGREADPFGLSKDRFGEMIVELFDHRFEMNDVRAQRL